MKPSKAKPEPTKPKTAAPLSPTFNPKRTFDFAAISNKKPQPINYELPAHDSSEVLNEKLDHSPLGTGLFMPSISLNDQPLASSMEYGSGHSGFKSHEKDREKWHGKHHKGRRAASGGAARSMAQIDYTSASAGTFSACMFDDSDENFVYDDNRSNDNNNNNNSNNSNNETKTGAVSIGTTNNTTSPINVLLGSTSQSRSGSRTGLTNRNSIYSPQGRLLYSVTPMTAANATGMTRNTLTGSPLSAYSMGSRGNTPISASYFSRSSAREIGGRTPISISSLKARTPLAEYTPELTSRIPHRRHHRDRDDDIDGAGKGKGQRRGKHRRNKSNSSQQSFSHANDNKRLVNEFLRSMAPPSSSQLNKTTGMFKAIPKRKPSRNIQAPRPLTPGDSAGQSFVSSIEQKSLQSLLFREVGGSSNTPISPFSNSFQSRSMAATPTTNVSVPSTNPIFHEAASIQSRSRSESRSSFDDSSSYYWDSSSSFDSMDLSSRDKSIEDEANNPKLASQLALNYNEPDNYQRHMAIKLYQLKLLVKSNIKDTLLRNELALQKNIQNFDSLYSDLDVLTERLVTLQELINGQYLSDLRRDFDDTDPDSYRSTLERTLNENVRELELLEQRMSVCKKKLAEQREAVKNMDSLLILENSILSLKKDTAFLHRYRYVLYEIFILVLVLVMGIFIRRIFF